jgi:hypothetical protein
MLRRLTRPFPGIVLCNALALGGALLLGPVQSGIAVLIVTLLFDISLLLGWASTLGAALAAWLLDMRIVRLSLGPVTIERQLRGVRMRWNNRWRRCYGHVVVVPRDGGVLRARWVLQACGELCGVALLVCAAAPINVWLQATINLYPDWSRHLTVLNVVAPLYLALGTLVIGALWLLARLVSVLEVGVARQLGSSPRAARHRALLEIRRLDANGLRPSKWDPATVAALTAYVDGTSATHTAHWLAALHALDLGDVANAARRLRVTAAAVVDQSDIQAATQSSLLAAWLSARLERDAVAASGGLRSARARGSASSSLLALASAALFDLAGNGDAAQRAALVGLDELSTSTEPGSARLFADLLLDFVPNAATAHTRVAEMVARTTSPEPRGRWLPAWSGRIARGLAGASIVAVAISWAFSVPTLLRNDAHMSAAIDGWKIQLGRGDDPRVVRALLTASDLPADWWPDRPRYIDRWRGGPAGPCSKYALVRSDDVAAFGVAELHDGRTGLWLREIILQTDADTARLALSRASQQFDCGEWVEPDGTAFWIDELDVPAFGDDVLAYQAWAKEDTVDRPYGYAYVFVREGDILIAVSIGSYDNPPEDSDIARLVWAAVSKAHTELAPARVVDALSGPTRGSVVRGRRVTALPQ